ncbi:uncharacterized protein Z518_09642 [Rhinocladiella mackenziei CBS 650.93]|uniref:Xylanolytic transcriptional activator regulatory domain-containing protein n=1 Tax=Rhinocladiella mackenziei CBS 650.93 TaxID=1442369 RepID=A0A0D2FEZ2_9EURO|nr:uncharacterized protein Z518_09642 [Rhinocladiella mackenziei CBS 650.93]KIX00577.1 hypothetical protein Z518_09642 [Rhinocladiella mackenziei CBS 650.93]
MSREAYRTVASAASPEDPHNSKRIAPYPAHVDGSQSVDGFENNPLSPDRPIHAEGSAQLSRNDMFLEHGKDGGRMHNAENFLELSSYMTNWLPFDSAAYPDFDMSDVTMADSLFAHQDQSGSLCQQDQRNLSDEEGSNNESPSHHQQASVSGTDQEQLLRRPDRFPQSSRRQYYVDGAGARDSRINKTGHLPRSISHASQSSPGRLSTVETTSPDSSLEGGHKDHGPLTPLSPALGTFITTEVYQELVAKASPMLEARLHAGFDSNLVGIPLIEDMASLIGLYFERFHKVFPFLDPSLLSAPLWGWCLCLATAAIGAYYSENRYSNASSDALIRLLHQLLTREFDLENADENLAYVQAQALSILGLCNARQERLIGLGYKAANKLYGACFRLGLFDEVTHSRGTFDLSEKEHSWSKWRAAETRRRTGYFIWMLDCVLAYTSGHQPQLPSMCINLLLPSSDALWEAEQYHVWESLFSREAEPVQFNAIIQKLYTDRRLIAKIPGFTTTVVIHALIRRTWDVANYYSNPLSSWTPGEPNKSNQSLPNDVHSLQYPACIPEFARWRNSACDALDVLHWDALSESAKAWGLEGPVFPNLHLARLVILCPIKELEALISNMAGKEFDRGLLPHDRLAVYPSKLHCERVTWTWVKRDRYKARLAVVHAAATFWNVRRFPVDSFIQPFAVYLATIVLWAYGSYTYEDLLKSEKEARSRSSRNKSVVLWQNASQPYASHEDEIESEAIERGPNETETAAAEGSESLSGFATPAFPIFMNLDRPCDDELVQNFIRSSSLIKTYLENVGELCSLNGPVLVLHEGARLLRTRCAHTWPIAETYASQLSIVAANIRE